MVGRENYFSTLAGENQSRRIIPEPPLEKSTAPGNILEAPLENTGVENYSEALAGEE